jgi:signal transduction histidine kinase
MASPRSANIKLALLATAVLLVVGTLVYTHQLVNQLLDNERKVADLYRKSLEFIANSSAENADYSFVFDNIIRTEAIDFPMIITDPQHNPSAPFAMTTRNITIDTTLSSEKQETFLRALIKQLDTEHPPLEVKIQNTVIQYVHYGESPFIKRLRWLPYIEIGVAGMFILIGYIGFSYIKRSEQSNIWVGMAKETAHQLGTPLSSLMGWLEMMKARAGNDAKQMETISEMENDLSRLQKITDRFSKIGSKPILKEENLIEVIETVMQYFRLRLPSRFAGKNIELRIENPEPLNARINRELFEWVIENLTKNALEAIEESSGSITFSLARKGASVFIDVKDTGKGLDMRYKKDIFRPGFSTKQRGWGLGLSLSKRIIEDYHKGKLIVKESSLGKGTTFRIKLSG